MNEIVVESVIFSDFMNVHDNSIDHLSKNIRLDLRAKVAKMGKYD